MKIALYSFLVGTAALAITIVMIVTTVTITGDTYQPTMFINSVIGCYGIGSMVTYYCLRQSEKLKLAWKELDLMHSELTAAYDALREKARTDQMTGFLNRDSFFEEFKDRRSNADVNSMLIVDADHFKKINDNWGHLAGDDALIMITDAVKSAVRMGDIVGRIGGEEFAVFLPGANAGQAREVGERIRLSVEALEYTPDEAEKVLPLTVSIGGAVADPSADLSNIMKNADKNLYSAKDSGRNMCIISAELALAA